MRLPATLALVPLLLLLASCADEPAAPAPTFPEPFHLNGYERSFGYAQAVKVGRTLYVSATMAVDREGRLVSPGDMQGQFEAAYLNLAKTLEANGAAFDRVVMERIYTTDMDALLRVLDRRQKVYPGGQYPALTLVQVERLVDPGFLVAIEVVVELPEPPPGKNIPP
jgi:enamine deaminase RidA (YjgF/YER057c/UK114 family)